MIIDDIYCKINLYMKNPLQIIANALGYRILPAKKSYAKDMESSFREIHSLTQAYSMVSIESAYSLYRAIKYISESNIPGSIVECGVWKGGSMMLTAQTLNECGDTARDLYLYDTFEGMPEPSEKDVKIRTGVSGKEMWEKKNTEGGWAKEGLEQVQKNMQIISYPSKKIHYIKGKVEETIPDTIPEEIALLRLDTDWFSSTYHELKNLYPKLSSGGILIIDDYGSWSGSKEATDQYFKENNIEMYLHRIDTTRIGVKK